MLTIKTENKEMDSIKIFKYIIAINVVIVFLFVVFVAGVKLFNLSYPSYKESLLALNKKQEKVEEINSGVKEKIDKNIEINNTVNDIHDKNLELQKIIKTSNNIDDCQKLEDTGLIIICEKTLSERIDYLSGNINQCEKIEDAGKRKICKITFDYIDALKEKDIPECSRYDNEESKSFCRQEIYTIEKYIVENYNK